MVNGYCLAVTNAVACRLLNLFTMKQSISFIFIISSAFILASCGNAETKADQSDTAIERKTDTTAAIATPKTSDENINSVTSGKADQSWSAAGATLPTEPNEIIARIDEHLVSAAQFTVGPSGGIQNCIITVTNNLPDITFQKVIVEVTIQKDDGGLVKTDYYTAINIEPGMSKVIKIPNTSQGTKVITHIVKVKSTELTKGEWVLAGSHFVAPN